MSDIFNEQIANDNLIEFLTKLTRFGIDQCLNFTNLIINKQGSIENDLLMEVQRLKADFQEILLTISSSDDSQKELLFIKLQTDLSKFLEINFRFKSIKSFELPISSSSVYSIDDMIDLGKSWKFSNIINTRFETSLIASNSQHILCYNNQNNFLHFILITGQFQGNIKWKYNPIIDILWCSSINQYIALTHHSIYTIEYNRTKSDPLLVNKILDLNKFQSARIACNQNQILFYIKNQQKNSIDIYNKQFNLIKTFTNSIPDSQSFCCTNKYIALTEKDQVLISYFPYVTPKKISLLLFDIETFQLQYTIDLNDCSNIYTMKCLDEYNIFFALTDEKILWFIQIDNQQTVQMAKKTFYTNQTEMCIINNRDLLLINVNAGHAIQLLKYRKIKQ